MLAALRSNCLKSTGPRTRRGKARSCLNALKHGRYAVRLPHKLVRAGYHCQAALYQHLHQEIAATFGVTCLEEQQDVGRLAARVWCLGRRLEGLTTKLECLLESEGCWSRVPPNSRIGMEDPEPTLGPTPLVAAPRLHIRVVDPWRRLGLVFWVQRRRCWTAKRVLNVLLELEPWAAPRLEGRWRRMRFRSRKLGFWERVKLERQARRQAVALRR